MAPPDSASFKLIERTVRELFPDAGGAGADGRRHRFAALRHRLDHIYKFSPVRAKPEDLPRFHGTNERITVSNADMIRFYHRLIENAAG